MYSRIIGRTQEREGEEIREGDSDPLERVCSDHTKCTGVKTHFIVPARRGSRAYNHS